MERTHDTAVTLTIGTLSPQNPGGGEAMLPYHPDSGKQDIPAFLWWSLASNAGSKGHYRPSERANCDVGITIPTRFDSLSDALLYCGKQGVVSSPVSAEGRGWIIVSKSLKFMLLGVAILLFATAGQICWACSRYHFSFITTCRV